jgi:hypothetical protein
MSDPLTKAQRAFIPINQKGDLPAAVTLARTVVSRELLSGAFEDDAPSLAQQLAGPIARDAHREVPWDAVCAQLLAALAMGIAIGQLVSPDVFKTGGAK